MFHAEGAVPPAWRWDGMRIRKMALAAIAPAVFGLAACGGNGTDGDGVASAGGGTAAAASASPSQSVDPQEQMLKFAQCMRQHGVNVPDPQPGEGIRLRMEKGSAAKVEAAHKACQQYAPGSGAKSPAG